MSLPPEQVFAVDSIFEIERRDLQAKILYLRSLLAEHGIETADDGASAFMEANQKMVAAAAEYMRAALELRDAYGSSMELLGNKAWR